MSERFNMHKNENELMYEGYIGRGGMATDQQRDNRNLKYGPKYDANNSNLAQYAGLTGNGSMNAAMVASSAASAKIPHLTFSPWLSNRKAARW